MVWRVGRADSATPHSDPSGGQAPALHFIVPPSIIGLQFGTLRPGRAGIEVDWGAHPGSESRTCFRTNNDGYREYWIRGYLRCPFSYQRLPLDVCLQKVLFSGRAGVYQRTRSDWNAMRRPSGDQSGPEPARDGARARSIRIREKQPQLYIPNRLRISGDHADQEKEDHGGSGDSYSPRPSRSVIRRGRWFNLGRAIRHRVKQRYPVPALQFSSRPGAPPAPPGSGPHPAPAGPADGSMSLRCAPPAPPVRPASR